MRAKCGVNMTVHEEIVRYVLSINLTEMETYVAPTSINLESPTFWIHTDESIVPSPNTSTE